MLISQYVSGVSPDFTLTRSGNQVTATYFYGLSGYVDEEGIYHWSGDIFANIGIHENYFSQENDRPMDLQVVATLANATPTTGTYAINDYNDGTMLEREFTVTLFSAAGNFVGTANADFVFGSAAADTFKSAGGGDIFEGGAGNDIYRVYSADTKILEGPGQGTADLVAAGLSYVLTEGAAVEQLSTTSVAGTSAINLTGNKLTQMITGNAGNNTLSSGGGAADSLRGNGGNDTYRVYNKNDVIHESAGQGTADRVAAAVSYTLQAGVDVERLSTNGVTGTSKINLTGNELKQEITGNAGDNVLNDGGKGVGDTLIGLGGNDVYVVHDNGDTIVEVTGQGTDRVRVEPGAGFHLSSGASVEFLETTSSSSTVGIGLTGNKLAQEIIGNAGINTLDDGGGAGADILRGLGGNDLYRVYNRGTTIVESASEGTNDVVAAGVDYVLGAGIHVEAMQTNGGGGNGNVDLTGNEFDQEILGNRGDNRLDGGGGMDTLGGGEGRDTYVFSTALGADNIDIIGFNRPDDTIELHSAIFTALAPGALASGAFRSNATGTAQDADDRIIYENDTGKLFYDADGFGDVDGIQFADINSGWAVTSSASFIVV